MGLPIYDFRKDIRNVLVTPQIRSRFMQLDPGAYAEPHSHDLGHEIFIVMQGRAIFEIDGESGEFGPGQMCVALVDQLHSIQVTSDEPMIMYLSVTPHIVPTHTMWDSEGRKLPYTFGPPPRLPCRPRPRRPPMRSGGCRNRSRRLRAKRMAQWPAMRGIRCGKRCSPCSD